MQEPAATNLAEGSDIPPKFRIVTFRVYLRSLTDDTHTMTNTDTSPIRQELAVLWLQSGGCGGCTLSLLGAESPDLTATLDGAGVRLLWHPSLSEASGEEVLDLVDGAITGTIAFDVLCIEGAMLRGPRGTGRFHVLAGSDRPLIDWVRQLAARARYTVAVGTCAAFGGVTAAGTNPTDACGLQFEGTRPGGLLGTDYRAGSGLPVINVAGCPTHPNWVTETLMALTLDGLTADDLDPYRRPRMSADHLVHHGCTRNEFYEYKASARRPSDRLHDGAPGLPGHPGAWRLQHPTLEWTGLLHPRRLCVHQLHRPRIRGARPRLCRHPQHCRHSHRPAHRHAQSLVRRTGLTVQGGDPGAPAPQCGDGPSRYTARGAGYQAALTATPNNESEPDQTSLRASLPFDPRSQRSRSSVPVKSSRASPKAASSSAEKRSTCAR